jgi:hypothetical protein
MRVNFLNLLLTSESARKHLPTDRRTVNELKSSTIKSVPKKKKNIQEKNETPTEAGASFKVKAAKVSRGLRAITRRKPRETTATKVTTKANASAPTGAPKVPELSDETIRLRAYFISERRRRFALPGDTESDWLEAKRQLLSESGSL